MRNVELPSELLERGVVTSTDCWEWTGTRDPQGYGVLRWDGRTMRVHRLVTHLAHGLDLNNRLEWARHSCDNPPCFNPDHLEPGTPADNARDCIERGRRVIGICRRGHSIAGENAITVNGKVRCRECKNEMNNKYRDRRRVQPAMSAAGRSCPRGHRLEHPNLVTSRAAMGLLECLACCRTAYFARQARLRGEPFNRQAESDKRYAQIMESAA